MIEEHRCGYDVSYYPDFSDEPRLSPGHLRFGYVVRVETEKRDALYGMIVYTRDGERRVHFEDSRVRYSCPLLEDVIDKIDIVYGYDSGLQPLRLSAIGRPILWRKKKVVPMTLEEISKKLGYDVVIVKEENK